MENQKPVRLAVIGYGGMGAWHTKKVAKLPEVELAGVFDIQPERIALAQLRRRRPGFLPTSIRLPPGCSASEDYRCETLPPRPVWQLLTESLQKPQKRSEVGFRYVPVGSGVENWAAIIAAIRNSTAQYVVVEQDESRDRDSLEAAKISRDFLQSTFGI